METNPFLVALSKYVYNQSLMEEYGIGKPSKLDYCELIKLRARFKLTQNQLYKINLDQ